MARRIHGVIASVKLLEKHQCMLCFIVEEHRGGRSKVLNVQMPKDVDRQGLEEPKEFHFRWLSQGTAAMQCWGLEWSKDLLQPKSVPLQAFSRQSNGKDSNGKHGTPASAVVLVLGL